MTSIFRKWNAGGSLVLLTALILLLFDTGAAQGDVICTQAIASAEGGVGQFGNNQPVNGSGDCYGNVGANEHPSAHGYQRARHADRLQSAGNDQCQVLVTNANFPLIIEYSFTVSEESAASGGAVVRGSAFFTAFSTGSRAIVTSALASNGGTNPFRALVSSFEDFFCPAGLPG